PSNTWTHVALTLNGAQGVLYVNGTPVATNTSMNLLPLNVAAQTNHLGLSKFAADPAFNGQIATFRSYGRALSAVEIAAPLPVITQPATSAVYYPGIPLNFSGQATDYAGRPLAPASLTWQISYAQDNQTNVVFGPATGITNGTFPVPTNATGGGFYLVRLTAQDSSNRTATTSVTVASAHPPAGWSAYFPLTGDATDVNGHYNGTLQGGATFVTDATRGSVLNLNGTNQYVQFPPGLAGMKTFMGWVKWKGGAAWQRIYDFGNDTSRYTVLTPLSGTGTYRCNLSLNGIAGEQIVDAPAALAANVWTHVAVVMTGNNITLYSNGVPVATNAFANLLPADLNATNLYLGKSQFAADPYFSGQLSSLRLFSRALTASEIIGPQVTIARPATGSLYSPGNTIAFAGGANDFQDAPLAASGLTWSVAYVNGTATNIVQGPLTGVTNGTFTIPATGVTATNGYYQIILVAVDTLGRPATNTVAIYPQPANATTAWSAYYPFTAGALDVSNNLNGTLVNGASISSDATRGATLLLTNTANQYVNLPAGAAGFQTLSGWVKWYGGNNWQRIFDFGQSTTNFFYLTPSDGAGLLQCAITPNATVYNRVLEAPTALPVNQWTHIAVTMDGRQGILYLNGKAVAVNNSVNLLPSDLSPSNCYLGRSEFAADPYLKGRISALRLNSSVV
ncbi:MAG TPA: LamG domain-containing protein, partial [Verrucomicrobiae bacterium]